MKTIKWLLAPILLGLAGTGSAWADRGHGHGHAHGHGHGHNHVQFKIGIGPYWGPGYYQDYGNSRLLYYSYPPVVVVPAAPSVYVEQAPAPSPQTGYWYYCNASRAYYPYVKECPGGWQQIVPQPPHP